MKLYIEEDDEIEAEPNHHYGTVLHVTGGTLVTRGDSGLQHSHTLATGATVTRQGKRCQIADVAVGARVRISVQPQDESVATGVECLRLPGTT